MDLLYHARRVYLYMLHLLTVLGLNQWALDVVCKLELEPPKSIAILTNLVADSC